MLLKECEQEVLNSSMNYESDKSSKNSCIRVVLYNILHSAPYGDGCKCKDEDQNILNVIATFQACLVLEGGKVSVLLFLL